jgi:NitT/TauT family transport system permease protein
MAIDRLHGELPMSQPLSEPTPDSRRPQLSKNAPWQRWLPQMAVRQPISRRAQIALAIASVVSVIGLYSLMSYRQHLLQPSDTTLPNLSQFIAGWKRLVSPDSEGNIWLIQDLTASFSKLGMGLGIGVVGSFLVGMLMGCSTIAEAFFVPPVSFFAKIPPTAMLAVYLAIFGFEDSLVIAMVAFGIFPTLTQSIYQAAKSDVTDTAIFKAYTLGASSVEVVWEVIYKQILPRILESIRLQVGPAMVFLIAAEFLLDEGFGYRMRMGQKRLDMSLVYSYLILLGVIGFVIDWLLIALRRRLCPWFGRE